MTDISTQDDEQARERKLAQEQGKKKEQDEQREREREQEKGRKKGLEEERGREQKKGGTGMGLTIVIALIVIALLVVVVAYMTLSVSVTDVTPGNVLPYTTMYSVTFPEGQAIAIGNSHVSVLSYQGELITDIDGDRQKLINGQTRTIAERRATVNSLGSIRLTDTIFKIDLTYKGDRDNQAYFDMAVHTSKQIPDMLLQKLIPREIDARPM
ncbi:MAG: hypothetical protein WCJ93_02895 [Methanomicrobiales archaeon]